MATVQRHLDGCDQCRHELAALDNTARLLSSMPSPTLSEDLWPGVAARIQHRQRRWWAGWWLKATAAAGVAASLLVGFVVTRQALFDRLPALPDTASHYVSDHQFLTVQDPLADRASIGVALAEDGRERE